MTEPAAPAPANPAPSNGGQPGGAQPQTTPGANPTPNPTPAPANPAPQPNTPANPAPNAGDQRLLDQVNGMRGMVDPLRQAGFSRPDDVQSLIQKAKQFDQLNQSGIPVEALLGARQPSQQPQQPGYLTEDRYLELQATDRARGQHEQSVSTMNTGLAQIQNELAGGEEGQQFASLYVRQALNQFVSEHGERYESNHPLAGNYKPLTAQQLDQVKANATKLIDEARGFLMRQNATNPPAPPQPSMNPGQTMQGAQQQVAQGGRAALNAKLEAAKQRSVDAGRQIRQGAQG